MLINVLKAVKFTNEIAYEYIVRANINLTTRTHIRGAGKLKTMLQFK